MNASSRNPVRALVRGCFSGLVLLLLGLFGGVAARAEDGSAIPKGAESLTHPAIAEGKLFRQGKRLFILPGSADAQGAVTIPRFCAMLRTAAWLEASEAGDVTLQPDPEQWQVRWSGRPPGSRVIVLTFDQSPRLLEELTPATAAADGSFFLPAHRARTTGEKLRFEPQPFKNTVGYWTVPTDHAAWSLEVSEPGTFAVGILQGCGRGQGGSTAELRLEQGQATVQTLAFAVQETGHFQNFRWRDLGELTIGEAGPYTLTIVPGAIQNAALMDVRAVHLVRLPGPR